MKKQPQSVSSTETTLNQSNADWVLLKIFCLLTGNKADTIRKKVRDGNILSKYAIKFGSRYYVNITLWKNDLSKLHSNRICI